MQVSERGLAFNAAREACVLTAHRDTVNLAIGFGLNKPGLQEGDVISIEEAIALYLEHAKHYEADIDKVFASIRLTQQMYDALFSLAYNCGGTFLRRHVALVAAVQDHCADPTNRILRDKAAYQIIRSKFSETDGPFNMSRRCREAILYTTGDYGDISKLKLWREGKNPRTEPFELIDMPTFRGASQ